MFHKNIGTVIILLIVLIIAEADVEVPFVVTFHDPLTTLRQTIFEMLRDVYYPHRIIQTRPSLLTRCTTKPRLPLLGRYPVIFLSLISLAVAQVQLWAAVLVRPNLLQMIIHLPLIIDLSFSGAIIIKTLKIVLFSASLS